MVEGWSSNGGILKWTPNINPTIEIRIDLTRIIFLLYLSIYLMKSHYHIYVCQATMKPIRINEQTHVVNNQ